jgi:hypothetical protein
LPVKSELVDVLYELDVAEPKNVTAVMQTTAINANSSAYSTRLAPRSSRHLAWSCNQSSFTGVPFLSL